MRRLLPPPTDRLAFRPYESGDLASVVEMFSDAQARAFYPSVGDGDGARRWIEWSQHGYATRGFGLWVVQRRNDGVFLGDCGLTYQNVEGQRLLEVGYHLLARHRGNGYATEAGRACVHLAFRRLGAPQVCSIVDPLNGPSIRVAARLHPHRRFFADTSGKEMLLFWTDAA